jgi:hypothetical protein
MNGQYILDSNGEPIETNDLLEWGRWMQVCNRQVAVDQVGDAKVSTVFLGLDHSFGDGLPVLWETMVFGGKLDGEQDRYTSREDAVKGHAAILQRVKEAADEQQQ